VSGPSGRIANTSKADRWRLPIWTFSGVTEEEFPDGLPLEMIVRVFRTYKGDIEKGIAGSVRVRNPVSQLQSDPLYFTAKEFTIDSLLIPRMLSTTSADGGTQQADLFRDIIADGRVEIVLQCLEPAQYYGVAQADFYLRAGSGSFALNYLKSCLGVWYSMLVTTAMGVMFSTFLAGPVALLATLSVVLIGQFREFIAAALRKPGDRRRHDRARGGPDRIALPDRDADEHHAGARSDAGRPGHEDARHVLAGADAAGGGVVSLAGRTGDGRLPRWRLRHPVRSRRRTRHGDARLPGRLFPGRSAVPAGTGGGVMSARIDAGGHRGGTTWLGLRPDARSSCWWPSPCCSCRSPRLSQPADSSSPGGTLARLRTAFGLSQANLGEVDPTSETIRLATLGLKNIAATLLWDRANHYKKVEDWTNLSATLEQLTKLQPELLFGLGFPGR